MLPKKCAPGPWVMRRTDSGGITINVNLSGLIDEEFNGYIKTYELTPHISSPQFPVAFERYVQFSSYDWDQIQVANGYLMAAAPELYESLDDLLKIIEENQINIEERFINKAKGAINKAKTGNYI